MSEDSKVETPQIDEQSIQQLGAISRFRLQMLAAQMQVDFKEGRPMANGRYREPSVRSNNRILFNALAKILPEAGFTANEPINDEEKRAVNTTVEIINGIMLEIALKESQKRIDDEKAAQTTTQKEG